MDGPTAPASTTRHMSERAQKAVELMLEALPHNPATVAAYVTGSQARGTATEWSDLDIYHVVRGNKYDFAHWDVIKDAVGNTVDIDIIVDSVETLGKAVNMYGSFEYWAMREGFVVYDDGSADWRAVNGMVRDDIYLPDCAPKWLAFAKTCLDEGDDHRRSGLRYSSFECIVYRRSIVSCIMAALTHDSVRFPHVKRLADFAKMLHDDSMVRGHDLDLVDGWVPSALDINTVPAAKVRAGAHIARSIYGAAKRYLHVVCPV